MSCYFRYIKDLLNEAGLKVTPQTKKALDQAIHRLMNVPYKHCMPDCWGEVKKAVADPARRQRFAANLKAATAASRTQTGTTPRSRQAGKDG